MLAHIRLKILCSSRLWWNSIVQIELHSHYCLFVKLDQFLGVLYSVEDLVGVYSVCLTIKKKDFNAVRGSHFCRNATYEWSVYPTLSDNRSPRSISLDVLHYSCYVALRIKFSQGQPRQLLGGIFFLILKIIIIKYRHQHAILIFKFFFDVDQLMHEELYRHSFKKLTLNHILSSLFNTCIFFLLFSLTPSPSLLHFVLFSIWFFIFFIC